MTKVQRKSHFNKTLLDLLMSTTRKQRTDEAKVEVFGGLWNNNLSRTLLRPSQFTLQAGA
jgi:hypothetical protein